MKNFAKGFAQGTLGTIFGAVGGASQAIMLSGMSGLLGLATAAIIALPTGALMPSFYIGLGVAGLGTVAAIGFGAYEFRKAYKMVNFKPDETKLKAIKRHTTGQKLGAAFAVAAIALGGYKLNKEIKNIFNKHQQNTPVKQEVIASNPKKITKNTVFSLKNS